MRDKQGRLPGALTRDRVGDGALTWQEERILTEHISMPCTVLIIFITALDGPIPQMRKSRYRKISKLPKITKGVFNKCWLPLPLLTD